MTLPTTIDTVTLREITGYSKAGITDLENAKVISRTAVNAWPFPETVTQLIAHLRERVRKTAVSDERSRWEAARAQREELKAKKLAAELCLVSDFRDAWVDVVGYMVAGVTAIPAQCTRDVTMRRTIEAKLDAWRTDVADYFERRADELGRGRGNMIDDSMEFLATGLLVFDTLSPELQARWRGEFTRVIEQRGGLTSDGEYVDKAIAGEVLSEVVQRGTRKFTMELTERMREYMSEDEIERLEVELSNSLREVLGLIASKWA